LPRKNSALTPWRLIVFWTSFMVCFLFGILGGHIEAFSFFVALQFFLILLPEIMAVSALPLCANGRPLLALKINNAALALDDTNSLVLWSKSCSLLYSGDLEGALAVSSELIELDPKSLLGYKIRAIVRMNYCDFAEGEEDCKIVLKSAPKDFIAYLNRAYARLHMGKFEECLADCDSVLKLKKLRENAYFVRNSALLELHRLVDAEACVQQMNKMGSKSFLVPLATATYYCHCYRYEEALSICASIPRDVNAKAFLGIQATSYIGLSEGELAVQCATALITEYPHFYSGYFYRATLLTEANFLEQAMIDCNMVLALQPYLSTVNTLRARLFLAKGDFENCMNECDQALVKNQFDVEAMATKARCLVALGRAAEAIIECARALEIEPINCNSLVALALAKAEVEGAASGLTLLERAMVNDPHSRFAYESRSKLYATLGEMARSKADLERYENMQRQLVLGVQQKLVMHLEGVGY